jgi:uncharacterized membrane protein YhaH (DUF805 family)
METKGGILNREEILKRENYRFIVVILTVTIGYFLISIFLNSIRANANIIFAWFLIIIQFTLYFSIFTIVYGWLRDTGRNNPLLFLLFIVLVCLGRVEDWEKLILPLLVTFMIVLSLRNKTVSSRVRQEQTRLEDIKG